MKRIALIGSDTATLARIKIILESQADVELVEGDQLSDFRITLVDGRVLVGDKDYSPEEYDAWRKEAEEQSGRSVRRILASLNGNLQMEMDVDMCQQERDWLCDEIAYNTSQANMMRRRDQHSATVKWQHVRPVKAHKPRRNSVRGRR